jgi:glycosyltransferase involved in cell wall biosynthesis
MGSSLAEDRMQQSQCGEAEQYALDESAQTNRAVWPPVCRNATPYAHDILTTPSTVKVGAMNGIKSLMSIVIVNYNYDRYIADAIDSALEQSYSSLEVVVVDDGSTDASREIIGRYGKRISTVFQPNAGQGAAYNAGWRAARGEFVLFLDSDDVLVPDAIAKVVAAFEQSDAIKVQFYLAQVDGALKSLGYLLPSYGFSSIPPREQIAKYGYYVSPPASGNAFRKCFLDEIMPITDEPMYRGAADGYTTGLAGIGGRIVSIEETLGYYRIHGTNQGGESGIKSVQQLRHMFVRDMRREATEHDFADYFNFHFPADRSRYCPGHTKMRLLSLRLFPHDHPVKTDTVRNLTLSGLLSAVRFPHLGLLGRIAVGFGFIGIALMPRAVLRSYFSAIVSPKKRNKTATYDLSVGAPSGARI